MHKTIATLEYGDKEKRIVRGPQTPVEDKSAKDYSSSVILGSKVKAIEDKVQGFQGIADALVENERRKMEGNMSQQRRVLEVLR